MKHFQDIANGLHEGVTNSKVIETAKKFMEDNGFRTNTQGKSVACSEVQQWAEREGVETELSVAIQTAIMTL